MKQKWLSKLKENLTGETATSNEHTLEDRNGSYVGENSKTPKVGTTKTTETPATKTKTRRTRTTKTTETPEPELPPANYTYVTTPEALTETVNKLASADRLGVDIETTGLDAFRDKIRLLQVARSDGPVYVLDADKVDITPVVRALNKVPTVLAHNMKFEASFLEPYGFNLGSNTYCTQLLYQVLTAGESRDSSLKTVAKKVLGVELDKTHQTADWSSEAEVTPEMLEYAAKDASILPGIYEELITRLKKAGNLGRTVELEMQTLKATVEMTRSGLPADEGKLKEYVEEAREAIVVLRDCMDTYITEPLPEEFVKRNKNLDSRAESVNWQSSEQIAWAFSTLDVELPLTKKGNPSTSKEALESVDHPLAEKVLELNKLKTVPTKWQNAIDKRLYNGRLYADWRQLGAASGRYSCAKPPLQGIPKAGKAKSCFVAPEGYRFVSSDLSQIEVRVWAAISGDEKLIGDFKSSELDLYESVAKRIFAREVSKDERDAMKAIVLGRLYGMGARSMQARLQRTLSRDVTNEEVRGYIDELASAYPKAEQWRKDQETEDPDVTTVTRTMRGRLRRKVTSNPQRFNTPIQGTAADVLKSIAVAVVDEIVYSNKDVELCALIHDEVVLLVEENRAEEVGVTLTKVMERVGDAVVNGDAPVELRVPIKADTSKPKKNLGDG